jgi:hypothetical protein
MKENGENKNILKMFGYEKGKNKWIIVKVELRKDFGYNCKDED